MITPAEGRSHEPLVTMEWVAELLGVSTRTVRRYMATNNLPHIKLPGGRLRFVPSEVEQWLHGYSDGRGMQCYQEYIKSMVS